MTNTDSSAARSSAPAPSALSPSGAIATSADPLRRLRQVETRSAELDVYEALRREIIHGLPPGMPLRLAALAERFGVSTMPVRAAIARLESEGLVEQRPRRGAVVTRMTAEDLADIYAIRTGLEGVAARLGCVALTEQDLDRMRACYQAITQLRPRDEDSADQYLALDWQLHDICYAAARSPRLSGLISIYRRNAERYFLLYLNRCAELPENELIEEFLRGCEDRDPRRSEDAISELFQLTITRLLPLLATAEPG